MPQQNVHFVGRHSLRSQGTTGGITNMAQVFSDVTLWHSSNSRHLPMRSPTTSEPNNDVNNNRPGIGWHDFHFGLTHWGRATHICVGKLTIIDSDNGLSPGRRQTIIWTNAGILLIGPLGTNFNEIFIEIHTLSFKKIHLKISSGKLRPFCLGLNVLRW